MFEIDARYAFYDAPHQESTLDNDARLLTPVSPLHPLWDDVRRDWMRDWLIE
jgi:hypothetical protein